MRVHPVAVEACSLRAGRLLIVVLQPPYVLAGDCPAEVRDGQAGAGTSGYLTRLARAESPADKPGDGLAQRLMGISGERDHLSVKIIRDVDSRAHTRSMTSLHRDAMPSVTGDRRAGCP
jgi:hypothetical protein